MTTSKGIVRMKDLEQKCCMSESTIRRYMGKGKFPLSINLGGRCVGWRIDDIEQWICNPEAFGTRNV